MVGSFSQPPDPRDLLDQVGLARDVVAPPVRARSRRARRRRSSTPKLEPLEDLGAARRAGSRAPSSALDARRRAAGSPRRSGPGPPTSIVPATEPRAAQLDHQPARPPPGRPSRCSGASPFSKRPEASVRSAEPRARCAGCSGRSRSPPPSARAWSSSLTSERWPPMMPAIEVGPSASAITQRCRGRACARRRRASSSSRRRARGGRRACRRATRSRSNACSGCAGEQHHVVGDVDDVEIGRWPGGRSGAPSATAATGPIVTSSNTRAVKRGHSSGSSTSTLDAGDLAGRRRGIARRHGGGARAARRWRRGPRARRRRRPGSRAGSA